MSKSRHTGKRFFVVVLVIVGAIGFFFYRAFRQNWQSVKSYHFEPEYPPLLGAIAAIVGSALLGTLAWQVSINTLSGRRPFTFVESFATVNSSSLTKYVPGKIWSYALQMYWLTNAGLQKSLVVYVNLLNIAMAVINSTLAALVLLALASGRERVALLLTIAVAMLACEVVGLLFHARVFKLAAALVARFFKRELVYYEFSVKLLVELHLLHFGAALLCGVSTYLTCLGIHGTIGPQGVPVMMAAFLFGDVAGFLALVVPGGIGVREAVMYWVMGAASGGTLALVLPLVLRLLGMLTDIALGTLAILLLRKLTRIDAESSKPVERLG